jgi:LysR family nitrogen assimilation transcriptional regulator
MDLRTLRYVAEAARLGSITKAAAELNVAQPALSRQIRILEEELGVVLLLRHRRGVKPTKEGIDLVRSAETLLRMAQQLREDMGSRAAEPSGRIRLGFLPGPGGLLIGQLVADFVGKFPKVTFLLREAMTAELNEALLTDKLDLAVMIYDVRHQNLHRKPLFAEDIWLAGSPSHWPFKIKSLLPRHLEGLPLIHASIIGIALERLAARHKLQYRTIIEGDTRTAARAAVHAGVGFMLMPVSSIAAEISRGELMGAPVRGLEVRRGLFWRSDHPQSRAVVEFMTMLDGAIAALKSTKGALIRDIASSSQSIAMHLPDPSDGA